MLLGAASWVRAEFSNEMYCAIFEALRADFFAGIITPLKKNGYPKIHETVLTVSEHKGSRKNCFF